MIVLYRRTAPHATLRTGFAGLIRFTEWLRHRDIGVKRLVGVVDTSHCRQEGGLSDERLERFYRLAGARRIRAADVPGLAPVELHWHHSRGTTGVLDLTDFRLSRTGRRGSASLSDDLMSRRRFRRRSCSRSAGRTSPRHGIRSVRPICAHG